MEHSDFVQQWKEGKIEVNINRSKALQITNSNMLPKRYQAANIFWSWIWILSIPAAFAVMYFYTWWAGLLILIILTPVLYKSTKKSAMQFIIDHSLEDAEFFNFALNEEVISIRSKP